MWTAHIQKDCVSLRSTEEGEVEVPRWTQGHMDIITPHLGGISGNPRSYDSFHSFFWWHLYAFQKVGQTSAPEFHGS